MPIFNSVYKSFDYPVPRNPSSDTIAWYEFNGNGNDSSGNNRNLTAQGSVSYTTLTNGKKVAQSQGWISGSNAGFYNSFTGVSTNVSTISVWCKTSGNGTVSAWGISNRWVLIRNNGTNWTWNIATSGDNNAETYKLYNGDVNFYASPYTTLNDGKWHHIVGFFGEKLIFYVDGEVYSEQSVSQRAITYNGFYVGKNNDGYYGFNGYFGDIIVEKKEWTAKNVRDYYELTKDYYPNS